MSRRVRAAVTTLLVSVCPNEHANGPEMCTRCFVAADAIALTYGTLLRQWAAAALLAPIQHEASTDLRKVNETFNMWTTVHLCACGVEYGHIMDRTETEIAAAHQTHRVEALAAAEVLPTEYATALTGYITDVLAHSDDDVDVTLTELLTATRDKIRELHDGRS